MSGSNCAGRIDLGALLTGIVGGLAAAALVLVVSKGREREAHSGGVLPQPHESAALSDPIHELDQRLARIEAAVAVEASRGERIPVNPPDATDEQPVSSSAGPEGLADLQRDIGILSKRIDALTDAIKEGYKPALAMPTLEQFHAARRDTDWAWIEDLRVRWRSDPAVALERVRGLTFDDLLKKIGTPTGISLSSGVWSYHRPYKNEAGWAVGRGVNFYFVGDRVSNMNGTD
jgi:hypothetical protein